MAKMNRYKILSGHIDLPDGRHEAGKDTEVIETELKLHELFKNKFVMLDQQGNEVVPSKKSKAAKKKAKGLKFDEEDDQDGNKVDEDKMPSGIALDSETETDADTDDDEEPEESEKPKKVKKASADETDRPKKKKKKKHRDE